MSPFSRHGEERRDEAMLATGADRLDVASLRSA
jgi:hypothetical protein